MRPRPSTATMISESMEAAAIRQQQSAAEQVDSALAQIRDSADTLSTDQARWVTSAERPVVRID